MTIRAPIDPADWVTLWQSELAALAVDREAHEALSLMARTWAAPGDAAAGRPGADAPPRPEAAGDAPGDERELADRVEHELAELRQRIAELERTATRR